MASKAKKSENTENQEIIKPVPNTELKEVGEADQLGKDQHNKNNNEKIFVLSSLVGSMNFEKRRLPRKIKNSRGNYSYSMEYAKTLDNVIISGIGLGYDLGSSKMHLDNVNEFGCITEVTQEQLELLNSLPLFRHKVQQGFMKVVYGADILSVRKYLKDLRQDSKSRPYTANQMNSMVNDLVKQKSGIGVKGVNINGIAV